MLVDKIDKIAKISEKIFEFLAAIFLILMTLITGYQIFMRHFLGMTPRWSEELSLILMIWFAFIGIAIGVERGIHLSIEFFVDRISKKSQKIINQVDNVIILIFGFILVRSGAQLSYMSRLAINPALKVPNTVEYIVVPICGFMIILYSIVKIMKGGRN